MNLTFLVTLISLILVVLVLSSGSSECCRREPKCWPKFEDVVNCRDVASFNAFVGQYLDERGLVGASRMKVFWALSHAWTDRKGDRVG